MGGGITGSAAFEALFSRVWSFAGSLGKTQPNKPSFLTAVALEISSDQVSSKVTATVSPGTFPVDKCVRFVGRDRYGKSLIASPYKERNT